MLKLWHGTEKRNRFYLFRFSAHEKERWFWNYSFISPVWYAKSLLITEIGLKQWGINSYPFMWHCLITYSNSIFFQQDADASEIKVQVCVYAFDLLYLNGKVSKANVSKCYLPVKGLYQETEYSLTQVWSIGHEGRSFNKDWPKPANWNKDTKMKREKFWLRRNTQRKRDIQIMANTQEWGQTFALLQRSLSKSKSLYFHILLLLH